MYSEHVYINIFKSSPLVILSPPHQNNHSPFHSDHSCPSWIPRDHSPRHEMPLPLRPLLLLPLILRFQDCLHPGVLLVQCPCVKLRRFLEHSSYFPELKLSAFVREELGRYFGAKGEGTSAYFPTLIVLCLRFGF